MAKKRYCGKGWQHTFGDGNYVIHVALTKAELDKLTPDARGSIYIDIWPEKSEPKKRSDPSHTAMVDDFRHPLPKEAEKEEEDPF